MKFKLLLTPVTLNESNLIIRKGGLPTKEDFLNATNDDRKKYIIKIIKSAPHPSLANFNKSLNAKIINDNIDILDDAFSSYVNNGGDSVFNNGEIIIGDNNSIAKFIRFMIDLDCPNVKREQIKYLYNMYGLKKSVGARHIKVSDGTPIREWLYNDSLYDRTQIDFTYTVDIMETIFNKDLKEKWFNKGITIRMCFESYYTGAVSVNFRNSDILPANVGINGDFNTNPTLFLLSEQYTNNNPSSLDSHDSLSDEEKDQIYMKKLVQRANQSKTITDLIDSCDKISDETKKAIKKLLNIN